MLYIIFFIIIIIIIIIISYETQGNSASPFLLPKVAKRRMKIIAVEVVWKLDAISKAQVSRLHVYI